jgi:hypothetical protein
MNFNLALPFHKQARDTPDRAALYVAGVSYSHEYLADLLLRNMQGTIQ